MCECLKREDGTWHVDECCASIMDEYHDGEGWMKELELLRAVVERSEDEDSIRFSLRPEGSPGGNIDRDVLRIAHSGWVWARLKLRNKFPRTGGDIPI
jgi:hypothetical protein